MRRVLVDEELLRDAAKALDLAQGLLEKSSHHGTILSAYNKLRALIGSAAIEEPVENLCCEVVCEQSTPLVLSVDETEESCCSAAASAGNKLGVKSTHALSIVAAYLNARAGLVEPVAWYTDWHPDGRKYAAKPHGFDELGVVLSDPDLIREVWHPLYAVSQVQQAAPVRPDVPMLTPDEIEGLQEDIAVDDFAYDLVRRTEQLVHQKMGVQEQLKLFYEILNTKNSWGKNEIRQALLEVCSGIRTTV